MDLHDIDSINFGIWSAEKIRSFAVCRIENKESSGLGSIYDERMGLIGNINSTCVTCGLGKDCWGHFGYIDLVEPIIHPLYYKIVTMFLKFFCKRCYCLLVQKEQMEIAGILNMKGESRINKLSIILEKTDICPHCSHTQPKIVFNTKENIICMEHKQKKDKESKVSLEISVEDIKQIFDNIPDEQVELLGLVPNNMHPKFLIMTALLVIPPCSRPPIIADGNFCHDDLTYQYLEIIKINIQLTKTDQHDQKWQKLIQSLKFRISTLFNNSKNKAKHPTDNRALKGLKERLAGKHGRIRGNMMGKRTDFSGRTVIGADPLLKLNQFGVPKEISQIHTVPEYVTEFNKEWLTHLINTNQANCIIKPNGIRKNLHYSTIQKGTQLSYGDIIVRGKVDIKTDKNGKLVIPSFSWKNNGNNNCLIFVRNGREKLLVGDKVIRNGEYISVKYDTRKEVDIEIGDIVERHVMDGDFHVFNRQPKIFLIFSELFCFHIF